MRILLAPMEGVLDADLRHLLTRIGGYDLCVTEFLRVGEVLLARRAFQRLCPELDNGGRTAAGTPVLLQLLGGLPQPMAENAAAAVSYGAPGIDLNFGCPSRFVNRKDGGSILLREPQRVHDIVAAVRRAVPRPIPVSAKLRLGYDDTALAIDNALAAQDGGADWITVHARTRRDGYRTAARWEWLARIRAAITVPMVANGDIRSAEDYRRCRDISGCEDVMLGRGAVGRPDLALQIRNPQHRDKPLSWRQVLDLLVELGDSMEQRPDNRHVVPRLKQWLAMLDPAYPQARPLFQELRRISDYRQWRRRLTDPMADSPSPHQSP